MDKHPKHEPNISKTSWVLLDYPIGQFLTLLSGAQSQVSQRFIVSAAVGHPPSILLVCNFEMSFLLKDNPIFFAFFILKVFVINFLQIRN